MPQKPASTTSQPRDRRRLALARSSIHTNGARPAATISQRKKASENGGMTPALERARMMLVTWATETATKPASASTTVQRLWTVLAINGRGAAALAAAAFLRFCSMRRSTGSVRPLPRRAGDQRSALPSSFPPSRMLRVTTYDGGSAGPRRAHTRRRQGARHPVSTPLPAAAAAPRPHVAQASRKSDVERLVTPVSLATATASLPLPPVASQ